MSAQEVGFFSLPAEIRLSIYELLLISSPSEKICSSILRTCKRIHDEASVILYSKNKIAFSGRRKEIWLGPINIKYLKNIYLYVDDVEYHISRFGEHPTIFIIYNIIDQLAREATGLRHMTVSWARANPRCLAEDDPHTEPGKDIHLVRELAKIQNLQTMTIAGWYASRWPQYLSEKMGVLVKEPWIDEYHNLLSEFHQGTENLIP